MLKKTENLSKIVGCFRTCHKGVFCFSGFNVLAVCFLCVCVCLVKLKKCKHTCLFFPVVFCFWGAACSCLFGFGRFRCFCVSCFGCYFV